MAPKSDLLDTAQLELVNTQNVTLYFYRQFIDCYECPLLQTAVLPPLKTISPVSLQTLYHQRYAISPLNRVYLREVDFPHDKSPEDCLNYCASSCDASELIGLADKGSYRITIDDLTQHSCKLETLVSGRNNLYPFIGTLLVYFALIVGLHYGGRTLYQRFCNARNGTNGRRSAQSGGIPIPDDANVQVSSPSGTLNSRHQALRTAAPNGRFSSIDAFRGMTILLMIFVNYGAGEYNWLQHAPWDGLNLADLVFPFFVFIMGASIAVGFKNLHQRSSFSAAAIFRKIVLRSINLALLGLVVNSIGAADFGTIRVPGVLQRFALSYGVVASIHLLSITLPKRRCTTNAPWLQKLFRFFPLWPEYSLALVCTVVYSYFTYFWRFDANCPVGYTGPGGLYDNLYYPRCVGGAAHRIDELIFSPTHSYKGFFGSVLYDPGRRLKLWHDPEGLLGTATSIVLTLIGLQVGHILVYNHEPWAKFRKWLVMTLVLGLSNQFFLMVLQIPVNKNLWSLTFITTTSTMATILFALCHFTIDIRNYYLYWSDGWPFHYAGQNAIFLYLGHEIAHDMFPFSFQVTGKVLEVGGHVAFLLRNLIGATVWLLISIYMAKKQIFITV